jgi:hypothetical protein
VEHQSDPGGEVSPLTGTPLTWQRNASPVHDGGLGRHNSLLHSNVRFGSLADIQACTSSIRQS